MSRQINYRFLRSSEIAAILDVVDWSHIDCTSHHTTSSRFLIALCILYHREDFVDLLFYPYFSVAKEKASLSIPSTSPFQSLPSPVQSIPLPIYPPLSLHPFTPPPGLPPVVYDSTPPRPRLSNKVKSCPARLNLFLLLYSTHYSTRQRFCVVIYRVLHSCIPEF